jgi:hypothetical protein
VDVITTVFDFRQKIAHVLVLVLFLIHIKVIITRQHLHPVKTVIYTLCVHVNWISLFPPHWLLLVFVFQAERIFSEVRRIENYRVEGMEIYSTTLWHLQKDVALSVLSKDLTDMDKNSPEVC